MRQVGPPVGEGSDRDSGKGSRDSSGNKEIWTAPGAAGAGGAAVSAQSALCAFEGQKL